MGRPPHNTSQATFGDTQNVWAETGTLTVTYSLRMVDEPETSGERKPVEMTATVGTTASLSGTAAVERGLNELRLAVLGILVGIGLSVGFGIEASWWIQLIAGIGSFVGACFLVWWRPSRHRLMSFMHRLTAH